MVQVRWLKSARDDLRQIYDFISQDSQRYATYQIQIIKKRTELLKSHPRIGRIVPEINNANIRELVEGNCRIIYRIVSGSRIDVLMVHHGARDLGRRLLE
ncbi:MAG: type II toxin-antitoxin system RelE/ParE family toxin [Bacteroidales bacterium]|nr:type II toxin-antitoxin system RelE/ParE family toxin [Bacteroidales bacterium]MCF8455680.1 type II toxin-antitoxin system RelE/ParE family toxin [Bacteroidales bacterium]